MMKVKWIALFGLMISFLLFSQCNKKTYTLDPPPSKVEGLSDNWVLTNVVQVDELSLAKDERNLTSFYISDTSTSVLEINFTSTDRTFEISLGSMGRNYLPTSGTWTFDDDDFPSYIYLEESDGTITTLRLQGPTRPQDQQLKFSFQRTCLLDGEVVKYVGYRYEFNRN